VFFSPLESWQKLTGGGTEGAKGVSFPKHVLGPTIILPLVLYESETWSLTLRE
jgi:hypothetical protein